MSDCRFGVSPLNYPDPDPERGRPADEWYLTMISFVTLRIFIPQRQRLRNESVYNKMLQLHCSRQSI